MIAIEAETNEINLGMLHKLMYAHDFFLTRFQQKCLSTFIAAKMHFFKTCENKSCKTKHIDHDRTG